MVCDVLVKWVLVYHLNSGTKYLKMFEIIDDCRLNCKTFYAWLNGLVACDKDSAGVARSLNK